MMTNSPSFLTLRKCEDRRHCQQSRMGSSGFQQLCWHASAERPEYLGPAAMTLRRFVWPKYLVALVSSVLGLPVLKLQRVTVSES